MVKKAILTIFIIIISYISIFASQTILPIPEKITPFYFLSNKQQKTTIYFYCDSFDNLLIYFKEPYQFMLSFGGNVRKNLKINLNKALKGIDIIRKNNFHILREVIGYIVEDSNYDIEFWLDSITNDRPLVKITIKNKTNGLIKSYYFTPTQVKKIINILNNYSACYDKVMEIDRTFEGW